MGSEKFPNWDALKKLRAYYLSEGPGIQYWENLELLENYDRTFAERIRWKWQSVLQECTERNWTPTTGTALVDWGCGTGAAASEVLTHWGSTLSKDVFLFDQSPLAMEYASRQLQSKFPTHSFQSTKTPPEKNYTLLISHALGEIPQDQNHLLSRWIEKASSVLWVEPGTSKISHRLIGFRERLRSQFQIIAPCPHQGSCGLAETTGTDWCHHFAKVPPSVFQSSFWKEFSTKLQIDLRSLPVSFLILDSHRKSSETIQGCILGRSRVYKGYLKSLVCTEESVTERRVLKRLFPEEFKGLKENPFCEKLGSDFLAKLALDDKSGPGE